MKCHNVVVERTRGNSLFERYSDLLYIPNCEWIARLKNFLRLYLGFPKNQGIMSTSSMEYQLEIMERRPILFVQPLAI